MEGMAPFIIGIYAVGIIFGLIILYIKFSFVSKEDSNFSEYLIEKAFMKDNIAEERASKKRKSVKRIDNRERRIDCFYCAEKILHTAKICRFCQRQQPEKSFEAVDSES